MGIGHQVVWSAIEQRSSGIRTIQRLVECGFPFTIGGEVPDFDGKQYIQPRKSLKVMCREIQLGITAAELAWADAGLPNSPDAPCQIDPERLGVVLGSNVYRSEIDELGPLYQEATKNGKFVLGTWESAMKKLYPLWMLKYLPNMTACQIGIAKDARGPNNTITLGEVSGLLAIIEAADSISRGHADIMLTGATGSMLSWVDVCWKGGAGMSRNNADPAGATRPFDKRRDGFVMSEGASVFVLESRVHAEQRGANIWGTVLGHGRRCEVVPRGKSLTGSAISQAIQAALSMGGISPQEVGHVSAHGLATPADDAIEAAAIHQTLGEVPVTAPKSFVGNSGPSGGSLQLAFSLLGLQHNTIPPTLNCDQPDCPIQVVTQPQRPTSPVFMTLSHNLTGQAVALLVNGSP